MQLLRLVAIFFAVVCLFGCDKTEQAVAPSIAAGEALFQDNCTGCHPRTGRGDYLKRIPATLLIRKNQRELMDWIRGSDQHREMPSFDHLSDEERGALADYLHSQILK